MKKLLTGLLLISTFYVSGQGVTIDTSFGIQGKTTIYARRTASIIDSNDNLIVCGVHTSLGLVISKYNTSGIIDGTFGTDGVVRNSSVGDNFIKLSISEQNGKYLIGCSNGVLRYNNDGTLDNTFGNSGLIGNIKPSSISVQPDKKILVSDIWGVLRRYTPDGQLDLTFNQTGEFSSANSSGIGKVVLDSDGKIYALGSKYNSTTSYDIVVFSLNSDGTINTNFGTNGFYTKDFGLSDDAASILLSNGKLYIAGSAKYYVGSFTRTDYVVLCMSLNGVLDSSFGSNGISRIVFSNNNYTNSPSNLIINQTGNIYLGGQSSDGSSSTYDYGYIVRLTSNGTVDNSFNYNGYYKSSNMCHTLHLLDNGHIISTGDPGDGGWGTVYKYKQDLASSINTIVSADLLLYPNPINDFFKISLNTSDSIETVEIIDINGRVLKKFDAQQDKYQVNDLSEGIYIVKINLRKKTITDSIIRKK